MAYKLKRHGVDGERTGHNCCQAGISFQRALVPAEPGEFAGPRDAAPAPHADDRLSLAAKFSLDTLLTRRSHRGLLPGLTSRINSVADELLEAIDTLCLAYGLSADGKGKRGR